MGLSESRLPKNFNVFIINFIKFLYKNDHLEPFGSSLGILVSPILGFRKSPDFLEGLRPRDHPLAGSFEISLECHRQGHLPRGTGTRQVGGQVGGCYVVVKNVVNLNV